MRIELEFTDGFAMVEGEVSASTAIGMPTVDDDGVLRSSHISAVINVQSGTAVHPDGERTILDPGRYLVTADGLFRSAFD